MPQTCPHCHTPFEISETELKFYEKISPTFNGEKTLMPTPTLCPPCRRRRRYAFRNERTLYRRKCNLCGKMMVSLYPENSPYQVYCIDCFWSDLWDPLSYGRDYDFNRTFSEQFLALTKAVPHMAIMQDRTSLNSEYTDYGMSNKNCYLTYSCGYSEDLYYSDITLKSKNSFDCLRCNECELAYESVDCTKGFKLFFSQDCINCQESYFLQDCFNCKNCFGSAGLHDQQYVFGNEQLSEAAYKQRLAEIKFTPQLIAEYLEKRHAKALQIPHKYMHSINSVDVTGDYIDNSHALGTCFDVFQSEQCTYCDSSFLINNDFDCSYISSNTELCYESVGIGMSYNCKAMFYGRSLQNCEYSQFLFSCNHVFGSCSLKSKNYCILNKQYSQAEYEKLLPRIIKHMQKTGEYGEYFFLPLSSFSYNETLAQAYFPLAKDEAIKLGFNWSDYEAPFPQVKKLVSAEQMQNLPTNIQDISDDVLDWALTCEVTGKLYKIIPQELKFLRENNLPLPRKCPDQRHRERLRMRNPRQLWPRNCQKCKKEIQTTYAPGRPEVVYCEVCYLKEVY